MSDVAARIRFVRDAELHKSLWWWLRHRCTTCGRPLLRRPFDEYLFRACPAFLVPIDNAQHSATPIQFIGHPLTPDEADLFRIDR